MKRFTPFSEMYQPRCGVTNCVKWGQRTSIAGPLTRIETPADFCDIGKYPVIVQRIDISPSGGPACSLLRPRLTHTPIWPLRVYVCSSLSVSHTPRWRVGGLGDDNFRTWPSDTEKIKNSVLHFSRKHKRPESLSVVPSLPQHYRPIWSLMAL